MAEAAAEDPDAGDGVLGSLQNNSYYYYTDYTLGTTTTGSDLQSVKVNTGDTRGSQTNPYVIASKADWSTFVTEVSNTSNSDGVKKYGEGQYFVLTADLDYKNSAISSVDIFGGTLYGLGYSIKNVIISRASNGLSDGLIRYAPTKPSSGTNTALPIGTAYISDLNLDNYAMNDVSNRAGAIVGHVCATVTIANCRAQGTIKGTKTASSGSRVCRSQIGGIVGTTWYGGDNSISKTGGPLNLYKCSAKTTMTAHTFNSDNGGRYGGLIGGNLHHNINVFDCYASFDFASNVNKSWDIGGVIGEASYGALVVKNTFVIGKFTNSNSPTLGASSFIAVATGSVETYTVNNCYAFVDVKWGSSASIKSYNPMKKMSGNSYLVQAGLDCKWTSSAAAGDIVGESENSCTYIANNATLLSNAKSGLSSSKWDTSQFDSLSPSSLIDIVNNPVIKESSQFNFYNYLSTGSDEPITTFSTPASGFTGQSITYLHENDGDDLPKLSYGTNKEFKGWVVDPSNPIPILEKYDKATMKGANKLYAVWEGKLTCTISSKNNLKEVEYENTIELTATPTISGMTSPKIKYQWKKGASNAAGTSNQQKYTLSSIGHSGVYDVEVSAEDSMYPLWKCPATSATNNTETYTIKQHQLQFGSFDCSSINTYVDLPLTDLLDKAVKQCLKSDGTTAFDNSNGTYVLAHPSYKTKVQDGTVTDYTLTFTPTDTANYKGWVQPITITGALYEIEFTFYDDKGNQFSGVSMKIDNTNNSDILYGRTMYEADIIAAFHTKFDAEVSAATSGFYFTNNDKEAYVGIDAASAVLWSIYGKSGGSPVGTVTFNNNIPVSYKIFLKEVTYTVTYKYDNGDPDSALPNPVPRYSKISKPTTDPVKTNYHFDGWHLYNTISGVMNPAQFDFDNTPITEDITLIAKWVDVVLVLQDIEITMNKATFIATETLNPADIKVTAKFKDDKGNDKDDEDIPLNDPRVTYKIMDASSSATLDSKFHYGYTTIEITFVFDANDATNGTKVKTTNVTVNKKVIDLSSIVWNDGSEVADGNKHTIEEIDLTLYPSIPDIDMIKDEITYSYTDGKKLYDDEGVSELGSYTVYAEFDVKDDDYEPVPAKIQANFDIVKPNSPVTVQWPESNKLPYNGEEQYPTPKFINEGGKELTLPCVITGSTDAKNVGTGYTVTVALDPSVKGYVLASDAQTDFTFEITICELNTPTVKEGTKIVYNGAPQSIEGFLNGYNADIMEITAGGSEINAKSKCKASIALKDTTNYKWKDSTTSLVSVDWSIEKCVLDVIWDESEFLYKKGKTYSPKVFDLFGLAPIDRSQVDFDGQSSFVFTGDFNKEEADAYVITVAFSEASIEGWANNYELNEQTASWAWVITPKSGMEVISIEWNMPDDNTYTFNNKIQAPNWDNAVFKDAMGNEITDASKIEEIKKDLTIGGDVDKSKWAGEYTANILSGSKYFIKEGGNVNYEIIKDDEGKGEEPSEETPGDDNPGEETPGDDNPAGPAGPDDGNGGGGLTIPEDFPLWQIITGSAAIVLSVIFAAMWANFDSKRRKAVKDEKKHKAAAAALSVLPVFDATLVLFGWSNMAWSIIAFALCGLALFMLIMMIISRVRCVKAQNAAELAYEGLQKAEKDAAARKEEEREKRDQARREEERRERLEREAQEREERRQQSEDMKMMMASMMTAMSNQQPSGGAPAYENIELIVGKVMQAMLPTMQQMMLPSSSSADNIQYIPYTPEHEYAHAAADDEEEDYEEEWDTEDDDDSDEDEYFESELEGAPQPIDENIPKKLSSNFRMRIKESSVKNRDFYTTIKNAFCAQKGVAYRVCGRVEKIKYHSELIAVIGIAKRSIKLWLALDPNDFDRERYFQKDVSDRPRYASVPMLVRVGSDRGINRALELLAALFAKFGIEPRRKYTEKTIQEMIFTLKNNRLLKDNEGKQMLCESIHVGDVDVMSDAYAETCIEVKDIDHIASENFATIDLDTISDNYLDGQKVNLDNLKKRGLVASDCNGFRVTAGTRLSKPLIVYANEFTIPAVKMIVLTGGRAIQLVQM